jgi:phosphatidylglycerophosphate synthase
MYKEFYEKYKDDIKKCFSDLKDKDKRIKQIPNLLTASRLIAPVFIIPAAFSGNLPLAILFTGIFEATDFVDGYFARKLDAVSEFGKDLDPIVDKIFATTLCIPILFTNPVIALNLIMEGAIGKVNTESKLKGNIPRTTVLGKIKTLCLSLGLGLAYVSVAGGPISALAVNAALLGTNVIQVLTYNQYKKIDREKEEFKLKENKVIENEIKIDNTTKNNKLEKVKEIARANDINELKKLKSILLGTNEEEIEKSKEKTLKK